MGQDVQSQRKIPPTLSLELLLLAHHAPLLASLGSTKALRLVSVRRPLSSDVAVRQAALFVQQSNVVGIERLIKSLQTARVKTWIWAQIDRSADQRVMIENYSQQAAPFCWQTGFFCGHTRVACAL